MFVLSTAKRSSAAAALAAAGVTEKDVRDIDGFIAETEPDAGKRRRFVAGILGSPESALDAIRGLAAYRGLQAGNGMPTHGDHYWGFPFPYPTCYCEGCVSMRYKENA